jgi:hypothetical protein
MEYRLTRAADMKTSDWSGGRTTEIFIHPVGSSVGARDFDIRVSTATVDLDESAFSDYSGYIRHIMPIEGSFELTFDGHCRDFLNTFDSTTFNGDRTVHSAGRCRDFNVIHRPSWAGGLTAIGPGDAFDCPAPGYFGVYALCDGLEIAIEREGQPTVRETLARGDCLIVSMDDAIGEKPARVILPGGQGGQNKQNAAVTFMAQPRR